MDMIICGSDRNDCHLAEDYIYAYYRDKNVDLQIRICENWQELCGLIRQRKADVIVIVQEGVMGLDIVTGLKLQTGKLIWFSDLDFGVQAYRLNVAYFNLLPVTQEKIEYGLRRITIPV